METTKTKFLNLCIIDPPKIGHIISKNILSALPLILVIIYHQKIIEEIKTIPLMWQETLAEKMFAVIIAITIIAGIIMVIFLLRILMDGILSIIPQKKETKRIFYHNLGFSNKKWIRGKEVHYCTTMNEIEMHTDGFIFTKATIQNIEIFDEDDTNCDDESVNILAKIGNDSLYMYVLDTDEKELNDALKKLKINEIIFIVGIVESNDTIHIKKIYQ